MSRSHSLRRSTRHLVLPALLVLSAAAVQAQGFNDLYLGTGAGNPGVSTGNRNTALGEFSLAGNTSGSDNTAVGSDSLMVNTIGASNTAVGSFALSSNTNGSVSVAVGAGALASNTTGAANTAVGTGTLSATTTASSNTAIGFDSLASNTTGGSNTALGSNALLSVSTGASNIGIGSLAGRNITSGGNNIDIGNQAPGNESDTIRIGNTQTATFLAGVNGVTISAGMPVYVDSNGRLGTVTSSLRFKEDVLDMGGASAGLLQLRPVTFRYKAPYDDGTRVLQYGLLAEDVAKIFPDLVQLDAQGKPFAVRYQALDVMLVNELQKEHQALQTEEARVSELEARLRRVEALLGQKADAPKLP